MLVTVSEILQRALVAADYEDSAPGAGFVKQENLLLWLNQHHRMFRSKLLRLGTVLSEATEDITLTGATSYAMTADPMAILSVDLVKNGRLYNIPPANPIVGYRYETTDYSNGPSYYRVIENDTGTLSLNFYPSPTSGTVRVAYAATPTTLTIDSSVNYPLGWDEYLVLCLAEDILGKANDSNETIARKKADVWGEVESQCAARLGKVRNTIVNNDDFNEIGRSGVFRYRNWDV